jgi:hypothetical protein
MIVKFLGLKISLELIILMLVIYLVMVFHALASCCNASAITEGLTNKEKLNANQIQQKIKNAQSAKEEALRARAYANIQLSEERAVKAFSDAETRTAKERTRRAVANAEKLERLAQLSLKEADRAKKSQKK